MRSHRNVSRRLAFVVLLGAVAVLVGPASTGVADSIEIVVADSNDVAVADSPSTCCVDITGCWSGCWKSFCNGHTGKLNARIVKCDACHYKCTFSGTFFKVVPFVYTATLTVTGYGDGVVYFRSSRNMPMFGGEFSMCGNASGCKFTANYRSPKDRGVFSMTR